MNKEQKAARDAATTRILEWMESRLCSKISCHQIAEEAVKRAFDSGYEYEPPDDPEFNALLGATIEDINDKYRKEGFDAGIAARDAEDAWVAVSDRLPERKEGWDHTEQCLVKYRATIHSVENHGIAYYHYNPPYDNSGWIDFAHLGRTPIAWMPIPKYQRTEGE